MTVMKPGPETNRAWDTAPVFSHDGKTLAYLGMKRPGFEADRFTIKLRSWPGGSERILAPGWDRSPGSIFWGPEDKTIYAIAGNLGQRSLFAIDIMTGKVTALVEKGWVTSAAFANNRIVSDISGFMHALKVAAVRCVNG